MISGGTGFVGKTLVHTFVGQGDDVVVLTRGESRPSTHACAECKNGGKLELARWTPEEAGDWMRLVDGADAVVHLAGASVAEGRWTDARKAELRSSRITSTSLLARAIAEAERKPKVFVSASAVGYYGTEAGDRVLAEDAPLGDGFLASLCAEWEASAAPARDAGVRTCFPRIGIVLGRSGGALLKMMPVFRAFVGGPIGDGTQYMPWIHIRDVVRAIDFAIKREGIVGPFNTTAPEPVTMDAFAEGLAKAMHRPAAMRVPSFAMKLAMGEASSFILTGQRAVPKRLMDEGFPFLFPDLQSALEDLVVS